MPKSGRQPLQTAKINIRDESIFSDVLTHGDWGLGWGFVQGKWDSEDPNMVPLVLMLNEPVFRPWVRIGQRLSGPMRLVERQNQEDQKRNEEVRRRTLGQCYDCGNDFFEWILGPSMVYTCAIWPRPDATLEEAQENKLRIITQKARIEPHHRVIDLGCGWGSLVDYIRRTTGARVKGLTLSRNQVEWAKQHYPQSEIEYLNYDRMTGMYDRIVSVGMAEHVGRANLADFFQLIVDHLEPGGRLVLQSMISRPGVLMETKTRRWTSFGSVAMPNGDVPSMADLVAASMKTGTLRIVHTESFGIHYARTGRAWQANTVANHDNIRSRYSEELYKTYVYSWAMGSAAFETGQTMMHIVYEKQPFGSPYTYSIV